MAGLLLVALPPLSQVAADGGSTTHLEGSREGAGWLVVDFVERGNGFGFTIEGERGAGLRGVYGMFALESGAVIGWGNSHDGEAARAVLGADAAPLPRVYLETGTSAEIDVLMSENGLGISIGNTPGVHRLVLWAAGDMEAWSYRFYSINGDADLTILGTGRGNGNTFLATARGFVEESAVGVGAAAGAASAEAVVDGTLRARLEGPFALWFGDEALFAPSANELSIERDGSSTPCACAIVAEAPGPHDLALHATAIGAGTGFANGQHVFASGVEFALPPRAP